MRTPGYSKAAGIGRSRGLWPVLLLLTAAVLVPTACLLWFMNAAVRNERLAVQQGLTNAYQLQLEQGERAAEEHWRRRAEELSAGAWGPEAPQSFARLVTEDLCDSVVLYDEAGAARLSIC